MAAAPQWPGQGETNEEPVASKVAAAASSLLSSATGGSTHQMETEQYDDAEYNSTTPTATTAAASTQQQETETTTSENDEDDYYWEQGRQVPTGTQLWHNAHWLGTKAVEGMEVVGEVFADFFGFNNSEFQSLYNSYKRQTEMDQEHEAAERERLRLLRKEEEERFTQRQGSNNSAAGG